MVSSYNPRVLLGHMGPIFYMTLVKLDIIQDFFGEKQLSAVSNDSVVAKGHIQSNLMKTSYE